MANMKNKKMREQIAHAAGLNPESYEDDPAGDAVILAATLLQVFEGKLKWSNSFYGKIAIGTKYDYINLGGEQIISYESIVNLMWQDIRYYFSCN